MDNRQSEKLEALFNALLKHKKADKHELAKLLNCSKNQINNWLKKLNKMGLIIAESDNFIEMIHSVDVLDLTQIQAHIDAPVFYCLTTPSTNQWAQSTKTHGIYLCEHQSTGRGRQSKKWITPIGQAIAVSINHHLNLPLKELTGLNIAIAMAIINTAQQSGIDDLSVKWPNDILKENAKVAGILLEASGNNQSSQVTIGIGINWSVHQSLLDCIPQKCSNIACESTSRTGFLVLLIKEVEKILNEFTKNKLKNILPLWNQVDAFQNKKVKILQGNEQFTATYKGISTSGALKVEINGTNKTLASGEVSMRKVD